jgi:hypothetical protein
MARDQQLTRREAAALLGVTPRTIRQYAYWYGPGRQPQYPPETDGRVSRSALLTWDTARAAHRGRPRLTPHGLTPQQWRDLRRLADGETISRRMVARLTDAGLIRATPDGLTLTSHGRDVIDSHDRGRSSRHVSGDADHG